MTYIVFTATPGTLITDRGGIAMALKYNSVFFFRVSPTWKELLDSVSGKIKSSLLDLSGKQDVLTGISGYDVTKVQVLKNDSGTLKWVDETPSV